MAGRAGPPPCPGVLGTLLSNADLASNGEPRGPAMTRYDLKLILAFAGGNFLFTPVFVLLPVYVSDRLGRGPEWYGFLLAARARRRRRSVAPSLRVVPPSASDLR
jgi:hypothetical protein